MSAVTEAKDAPSSPLELSPEILRDLWAHVGRIIERYHGELERLRVAPDTSPKAVRALLETVDFARPVAPESAIDLVVEGLRHHQVHNGHPRYFGLFNPATSTMSLLADSLVAAFNPQLAAWTHAPFACEVEQLVLRELGTKFGYTRDETAGSFTSGGAEANHSALLLALTRRFSDFGRGGVRALPGKPVIYVSSESHHSFLKAARLSGLGTDAVRQVEVDEGFVMSPEALRRAIRDDRAGGACPLLVVATLGTTGAGLIDPVDRIAEIGHEEGLWVHADAAWGGAAALVPELREILRGVERADSITFDAHKWLGVAMGAGMFFTRHRELLEQTFGVLAGYMPLASEEEPVLEPHRSSMQWTRRFIGLKLFMTLLVAGFPGYERTIREMVRLGDSLRSRLRDADYEIVNQTPLPVVCCRPRGCDNMDALRAIADRLAESGETWVSITSLGGRVPAIRACISNFRTGEPDLDRLLELLQRHRP